MTQFQKSTISKTILSTKTISRKAILFYREKFIYNLTIRTENVTGVMLSIIFGAPVGVPGKDDEIIRIASLSTFVSFLSRYFLLRPPAQDTHAYDMVGHIGEARGAQGARAPPQSKYH